MHERDGVYMRAGMQGVWSDGSKGGRGLRTWESAAGQ